MEHQVRQIKDMIHWYDRAVLPLFEKVLQPEKVAEFDRDRNHLARMVEASGAETAVCFLGPSGIGKSTLINAVVGGAEAVVPSGGVGPLTAQAIVVRSRSRRALEVEYHGKTSIIRLVFGIEQMFKTELGSVDTNEAQLNVEGIEENELPEDASPIQGEESSISDVGADSQRRQRREQFRRSAQLLVTGTQDADRDIRYLVDSLREVVGGKRVYGTAPDPNDSGRLEGIRNALSLAKQGQKFLLNGTSDDAYFRQALHEHATGYLAPLIKNLTLDWPSSNLAKDVTLVDLPGVGIARDVHADVTRKWIREEAHALVLVVDHRGMTESLAEALRRSEFLNSLLYSADEPEDDPILMVAVTRIDDVAGERYRQDRTKRKFEHFIELVEEARQRLRDELHRRLEEIWLNEAEGSTARQQVVSNLLESLQVHPLSAPEYVKLIADDEDDRSFLKGPDQTGIPGFVSNLETLAAERVAKMMSRLQQRGAVFRDQVVATLSLIRAQWEGEGPSAGEADRLRAELELFMQPLRLELANRQGSYRAFLKKGIPQRIKDLIQTAQVKATKEIDRYLTRLWDAHWGTLRASVRRGGRYSGASDINLPTEFALRFEEPVAEAWGKEILKDIRRETKDYADDCVSLVEQVAQWATTQGARVQIKVVEAQRDAIVADAKKLESVGREMVKEMRDEAKAQLVNAIEEPIKHACTGFVKKNLDVGPGVKRRILTLYEELSETVTEAAEEPARKILLRLYREVEKEILEAFSDGQNPLDSIANSIVTSQQKYLERSNAQKRKKVLGDVDAAMQSLPDLQADEMSLPPEQQHAI